MNRWFSLWFVFCWLNMASQGFAQEASSESNVLTGTSEVVSTADAIAPTEDNGGAKWQLNLSSESWVGVKDQNENGKNAQYTSLNAVGAIYNVTKKTQVEIRQYFEYATQIETLTGASKQLHQNESEMSRSVLRVATKIFSIFGSKPTALEGRYYAANDRIGRENKDNGLLRTDLSTTWDLTPKISAGIYLRGAVQLNSLNNPNAAKGSDAEYYRLLSSPNIAYNFNDKLSTYYAYYVDQISSDAQRGRYSPDIANDAWHEIGLLWTIGPVLVNPAIVSVANQNNAEASLFTNDGRVFANENSLYYMNLYATF